MSEKVIAILESDFRGIRNSVPYTSTEKGGRYYRAENIDTTMKDLSDVKSLVLIVGLAALMPPQQKLTERNLYSNKKYPTAIYPSSNELLNEIMYRDISFLCN